MFTHIFNDLRSTPASVHSKSLNLCFIFKSFALFLASTTYSFAQDTVQAIEQQTDIIIIAAYSLLFAIGFMSGQQR